MSPGWAGREALAPEGQEERGSQAESCHLPIRVGLGPGPRLAPLLSSKRLGARARADRAPGSIFLTALEQVPVQGFAGRWLKVVHCAGDQSKDGDPVALMAALGANAGGVRGWRGQTGRRVGREGEKGSRAL